MDGYFRNTTPYTVLPEISLPECFVRLEAVLGRRPRQAVHPDADPLILVAHNLCQRMGDVEFYADRMRQEIANNRGGTPAVLSSLLVGHFASCKAVLDAGSMALALVYELCDKDGNPIRLKEQDFGKRYFWNVLTRANKERAQKYEDFADLIQSIVGWRDASLHRVAPLVMLTVERLPDSEVYTIVGYHFTDGAGIDYSRLIGKDHGTTSYHALELHELWQPRLLTFCQEVCQDIEINADRHFSSVRVSSRSIHW